jgi:hypothetical protein
METEPPPRALVVLGGSSTDPAKALLKGILSGVPLVGGVISEIVGQIIPDQRMDRLERYVIHLGEELQRRGADEQVEERMRETENVDLFEDGAIASARALSEERRQRIARLVAAGISGDDQARLEAKRLLALLAEIDDGQLIILASYLRKNQESEEFRNTHAETLSPGGGRLGDSARERDVALVQGLAREKLLRLGLLEETFRKPRRGESPELDENTGRIKVQGRRLSQLGRLLLRRVGLAEDGDA